MNVVGHRYNARLLLHEVHLFAGHKSGGFNARGRCLVGEHTLRAVVSLHNRRLHAPEQSVCSCFQPRHRHQHQKVTHQRRHFYTELIVQVSMICTTNKCVLLHSWDGLRGAHVYRFTMEAARREGLRHRACGPKARPKKMLGMASNLSGNKMKP